MPAIDYADELTADELASPEELEYLDWLNSQDQPQSQGITPGNSPELFADLERRQQEQEAVAQFRGAGPTEREAAPFLESVTRRFMPGLTPEATVPQAVSAIAAFPMNVAGGVLNEALIKPVAGLSGMAGGQPYSFGITACKA